MRFITENKCLGCRPMITSSLKLLNPLYKAEKRGTALTAPATAIYFQIVYAVAMSSMDKHGMVTL